MTPENLVKTWQIRAAEAKRISERVGYYRGIALAYNVAATELESIINTNKKKDKKTKA